MFQGSKFAKRKNPKTSTYYIQYTYQVLPGRFWSFVTKYRNIRLC
jgi:hypothetical protein